MVRHLVFALVFVGLLLPASAQTKKPAHGPPQTPQHPQQGEPDEEPEPPPPTPQVRWEIRGVQPPSKDIIFVIDTSGSMDGYKVQDAIRTAMQIAEAPLDDLQIAIVTFGTETHRWSGTPDKHPETGEKLSRDFWSLMPSKDNLDAAYAWMQANRDEGGTNIIPAVRHAFETCSGGKGKQIVKDLSIIIISDGVFSEREYADLKISIQVQQISRIAKNLPEAAIGMVGVGIDADDSYNLLVKQLLGKKEPESPDWQPVLGVIGYYRLEYPAIEEDEE